MTATPESVERGVTLSSGNGSSAQPSKKRSKLQKALNLFKSGKSDSANQSQDETDLSDGSDVVEVPNPL